MKAGRIRFAAALAIVVALTGSAAAQHPKITNAKMQTRSAVAGLEREFRGLVAAQETPAWIGYAVPVLGEYQMCCRDSASEMRAGHCICRLEGQNEMSNGNSDESRSVTLEGPQLMLVLFRIASKSVEKVRTFSEDCALDAGGLPVYWLSGVKPAESVALLASFVHAGGTGAIQADEEKPARRRADAAIAAIAMHADPAADATLADFIGPSQPEWQRGQTAFWLGAARGRRGYDVLKRMVKDDPSECVRDKVVFALSISTVPEAVDAMIAVARDDRSSHVRGQALFWLGQKAGKKAAQAISAAIENDPDTDIKKKAVFALSQLPKDEGVPLLIQVAKTNRNPAVRKQAIFWLGQSDDSRALAFFGEVLKR